MGREPCSDNVGIRRGPWSPEEDQILIRYITLHGHGNWRALPKKAGLLRCGKSCRLRWMNYLRPDIKRGNFTKEEEDTIIQLHQILGNKWSAIAARLPGRTDNEIKNVWNTHFKKKLNKKQEDTSKETSVTNMDKSRPMTTTSVNTSRGQDLANTCGHHVTFSPQQCSSIITEDMSSTRMGSNVNNIIVGSTSTNSTTSICNNEFLDLDEPFWSEILSEGAKSSNGVADEAAAFQLSPLSGLGIGGKCGYDDQSLMEFWYQGLNNSDDFFANNIL